MVVCKNVDGLIIKKEHRTDWERIDFFMNIEFRRFVESKCLHLEMGGRRENVVDTSVAYFPRFRRPAMETYQLVG